jgi:hypothetical protein
MNKVDPILLQALLAQEAYDAGIVPYTFDKMRHDMNRLLADLPPEESRKLRRRFRKMWRNIIRKNLLPNSNDLILSSTQAHRAGLGKSAPSVDHSWNRKNYVLSELARRARKKAVG